MSTEIPSQPMTDLGERKSPWASGLTVFAATMMIISGVFQALAGVAALVRDEVYVATPAYLYSFDLTGWGWVHLILGLVVGGTGIGVLKQMTWARIVGVALASASLLVNFAFLPHYPFWSIMVIALDVLIIWQLASQPWGRD